MGKHRKTLSSHPHQKESIDNPPTHPPTHSYLLEKLEHVPLVLVLGRLAPFIIMVVLPIPAVPPTAVAAAGQGKRIGDLHDQATARLLCLCG